MNPGGDGATRGAVVWAIDARDEVLDEIVACCEGLFDVTCFSDARRAILHARRQMPRILILGLVQNSIDPLELIALRAEFDELSDLPVIALYGSDDVVSVDEVMAAGVDDAVARTRIGDELTRRIQWRLGQSSTDGEASPLASIQGLSALRSFDFLNRVIEASPNAIVAARRSGEIVLFNPAAERILRWDEDQAVGMSVRNLYPEGGAERIMRMMRSGQHGGVGRIDSLREVVVDIDGELIPVEISAALIYEEGREIATVGVFTDLRQRMKMEERLQEAMEALEQTQRQAVVAEVAGAAAHELNQPLTSLLGYVEFLRREVGGDEQLQRVVSTIHSDATRIAEVVRKIGRVTRYRTRDYAGGEQIVDLEEASSADESEGRDPTAEIDRANLDETP